jgi:cellulose synthase/poly-beta-1,6-N-acetylglucosamine synthase-like glycosyltransferase
MSFGLPSGGDALLAAACLWLAIAVLRRTVADDCRWARTAVAGLGVALGVRYMLWRWTATVPWDLAWSGALAWSVLFALFETLRMVCEAFTFLVLSRTSERHAEADRGEARLRALGDEAPPVDVFIPTYDEPRAILRRTILGAKALDWPRFRIFVLDDTDRDWLKDMCAAEGVHYIARRNGQHAKAGNLNNALAQTRGPDAAPYVMCLDADFVPHKNFLYRTIGLFDDPTIGIVQTPQYFFNPDPTQVNLRAVGSWVDEQRFFFDVYQESKDAVDAAFCCGTSCVWRRAAIEAIGGVPTDSVVEDIHLSFKLMSRGWTTRYLNEILSNGLAAETVGEFVAQRVRWAIGCVQALHVPYGPFHVNRLTLRQRAHYLATVLYWLNLAFVPMALLAPAIYWIFGISTFRASLDALAVEYLPYAACAIGYLAWTARGRLVPFVSELPSILFATDVVMAVWPLVFGSRPRKFHVTQKGVSMTRASIAWQPASRIAVFVAANLVGLVIAASTTHFSSHADGDMVNLVWGVIALLASGVALLMCIELPRRRSQDRFRIDEPAVARITDGAGYDAPVVIQEASLGGVQLRLADPPQRLTLLWRELALPAVRVRAYATSVGYRFDLDPASERELLVTLYTGGFRSGTQQASPRRFVRDLFQRLFMVES